MVDRQVEVLHFLQARVSFSSVGRVLWQGLAIGVSLKGFIALGLG
jgi:hypothetical protein